jgi:adenylate cyclase
VSHSAQKPRLLIVDDEPDMLDFLERVLRRRYRVTRCNLAEEALEALEQDQYEILVTDQKMPRVSGLELIERLGDKYPMLVRVLISGFTELPDIKRAVELCRIHAYILKPVDSQKLLEAIDEAYKVRDSGRPPTMPE